MDYKEKYEQALEKARELMDKGYDVLMPEIFPELQESEDEKVRLEIRNFIWEYPDKLPERTKWLAWFEKQGECSWEPTEEQLEALDYAYNSCPGTERGNYYESILADLIADLHKLHKKQDENKPADKVEPKFKPGDWIVFNGLILHIDEVVNGYYRTTSRGDGIHNSYDWDIDNAARLWTIQEARDGDVLINWNNTTFIFRAIEDETVKFHIAYNERLNTIATPLTKLSHQGLAKPEFEFHPASKEQCDTLFAKMKKAGYKWDSEKKELKKIEPKKVNADKVIEWLKGTIRETKEYFGEHGEYYDTHLTLPYDSIEDLINNFKEDFGL